MKRELTPRMQRAVDYARDHGGALVRHPGGYWASARWKQHSESFSTATVDALITRGVAQYVEWKEGRNGRFPIKAQLTEAQ